MKVCLFLLLFVCLATFVFGSNLKDQLLRKFNAPHHEFFNYLEDNKQEIKAAFEHTQIQCRMTGSALKGKTYTVSLATFFENSISSTLDIKRRNKYKVINGIKVFTCFKEDLQGQVTISNIGLTDNNLYELQLALPDGYEIINSAELAKLKSVDRVEGNTIYFHFKIPGLDIEGNATPSLIASILLTLLWRWQHKKGNSIKNLITSEEIDEELLPELKLLESNTPRELVAMGRSDLALIKFESKVSEGNNQQMQNDIAALKGRLAQLENDKDTTEYRLVSIEQAKIRKQVLSLISEQEVSYS